MKVLIFHTGGRSEKNESFGVFQQSGDSLVNVKYFLITTYTILVYIPVEHSKVKTKSYYVVCNEEQVVD